MSTWNGRVELRLAEDDETHPVRVQAPGAGAAVERAVRQVLSGRPRHADSVFEVTVTLTKEEQ